MNELLGDKSKYQKQLQKNIASVIRASAAITTDGIDEKLMELQQELVKKANNKEAYDEIVDYVLYCICAVLYCSNIFFGILNKLPCRINVMCN